MARAIQTFAPESFYKSTDDFLKPTLGSGVEVVVAWRERMIGTYHFHHKSGITVGSHASCDVPLPLVHSFVDKIELIKMGACNSLQVPAGVKVFLVTEKEKSLLEKTSIDASFGSLPLGQRQMVEIYFSEDLKLVVRPAIVTQNPRLIPFMDISSDGFLAMALALFLSFMMALLVKLNPPVERAIPVDEFYPTPLFIQSPDRIAKILNPLEPPIIKQKELKRPLKLDVRKNNPRKTKPFSQASQSSGNKTKASAIRKSKAPNKAGSVVPKGKSIKVSHKPTSQMQTPDLKKSKLFAVLSGQGARKELDASSDGAGTLAGLANKASNSAGAHEDRLGTHWGSKFKEAGSTSKGNSNVGVQGLAGGNGLGSDFGEVSLGNKKSVSIVPSGEGMSVAGEIDRDGIRQVFFDNAHAIRSCYERVLNKKSRLQGKLMLDFDIGPGGQVMGSPRVSRRASSFCDQQMAECLLGRLKSWTFPDPPSGQVVNVRYPLAFASK